MDIEMCKAIMSPEQFADWQRRDKTRREFWRLLEGPAQRPLGSNADEWHLFLSENMDALGYLAVQIAEAIEEGRRPRHEPQGEGSMTQTNYQAMLDALPEELRRKMKKQNNGNEVREALIETLNTRIQPKRSAKLADSILAELWERGFKIVSLDGSE
jgi:hypothetical protein